MKDTDIKTKSDKNVRQMTFPEKVATVCDCSTRMVQYTLGGNERKGTALGEKIELAAMLLEERENKLLQEVKKLVNF